MIRSFLQASDEWVCEGYSSIIRYIAEVRNESYELVAASIHLNPLPAEMDNGFQLKLPGFVAGQQQANSVQKESLKALLTAATEGTIELDGMKLILRRQGDYGTQSLRGDGWYSALSLQLIGDEPKGVAERLAEVDDMLRSAVPPFDGLADLTGWLFLPMPQASQLSTLAIEIGPPVDLILDKCQLSSERLILVLHAHPKCDISRVGMSVRAFPGEGIRGRYQVAGQIVWADEHDGRREGTLVVECPNADSALAMLMFGTRTIRRQWFLDPTKAGNHRWLAVQQFDKDLRMIRNGLFESSDATKFEMAVAALLFLLGFAPVLQLETDSPDLIVATPTGRLALVECTTRVADLMTKIGKLVDRRGALAKTLESSNARTEVVAALVCRLPKIQIAAHQIVMRDLGVVLIAAEELNDALIRVRSVSNPDQLLDNIGSQPPLSTPTDFEADIA